MDTLRDDVWIYENPGADNSADHRHGRAEESELARQAVRIFSCCLLHLIDSRIICRARQRSRGLARPSFISLGSSTLENLPRPRQSTAFEIAVHVVASDIDEQDHVNNTVYLRWVQEVATAHWEAIASSTARETIGWVVLRHEIDYKSAALPGDEILLRTWVGKATRLTFERFTEIRRRRDAQLLSQARTVWCPINNATGKPTRVPAEVRAQFSSEG